LLSGCSSLVRPPAAHATWCAFRSRRVLPWGCFCCCIAVLVLWRVSLVTLLFVCKGHCRRQVLVCVWQVLPFLSLLTFLVWGVCGFVTVYVSVVRLLLLSVRESAAAFVRVAFMLFIVSRRFLGCIAVVACSNVVWMSSFSCLCVCELETCCVRAPPGFVFVLAYVLESRFYVCCRW
jgi:hypothetical protein